MATVAMTAVENKLHLISVYVSGVQGYWDLGNYVDTISSFIHLSIMRQETPVCEVLKIYQCI